MTFRVRAMTLPNPAANYAGGDMTFGRSSANFLVDTPAAVGQLVQTRFGLWEGEFFLDLLEGTPYFQRILGKNGAGPTPGGPSYNTQQLRDAALQARAVATPFVTGFSNYSSQVAAGVRAYSVQGTLSTAFGELPNFNVPVVEPGGTFELGGSSLGSGQLGK